MKQILFLFLFPCFALAQYQGNANQKITLGEQTTADGLVWRGRLADTANLLTNKLDTSVYIVLDTGTRAMWYYRASTTPKWTRLVDSLNNLEGQLSLTTKVSGTLPLGNGGTGSATKNFVDLTTTQNSIGGSKTFTNPLVVASTIKIHKGLANDNESTAIGDLSLNSTTTGIRNTAFGQYALQNMKTGNRNFGLGQYANYLDTAGSFNVAVGWGALSNNLSGSTNLALGYIALYENTNGSSNTAIGNQAAGQLTNSNTTGSNNTFIGNQAVGESPTTSNHITLGNSSITKLRCQVALTTFSDGRDKTDILPLNYGMNFIDKLKPVSFIWDMRDGGKIGVPEIGFIAQDLQQAQIDLGINVPNLVSGTEEKLDVTYNTLLPIIVKALQEANEKIKSLEQRLLILENK